MNAAPVRHESVAIEDSLIYHLDGKVFSQPARRECQVRHPLHSHAFRPVAYASNGGEAPRCGRPGRFPTDNRHANTRHCRGNGYYPAEPPRKWSMSASPPFSSWITENLRESSRTATFANASWPWGRPGNESIRAIMSKNPTWIDSDALAYEAALTMMQKQIHHLPVCEDGNLTGMVSRSDFMRLETEHPLYLVNDIAKQTRVDGIIDACRRLPGLIAGQINGDANGEQLGKFITTNHGLGNPATCVVSRRQNSDRHRATTPGWQWVRKGATSNRRAAIRTTHSFLTTPRRTRSITISRHSRVPSMTDWTPAVTSIVPGDVMASNPKWRQPLRVWKKYFNNWMTVPEEKALMHANIFFDLRCVHGDASLVDELKASIREDSRRNEIFLALMAKNAMNFQPPLGFFRQFVLEKSGEHKNTLDMKLHGIMPIVEIGADSGPRCRRNAYHDEEPPARGGESRRDYRVGRSQPDRRTRFHREIENGKSEPTDACGSETGQPPVAQRPFASRQTEPQVCVRPGQRQPGGVVESIPSRMSNVWLTLKRWRAHRRSTDAHFRAFIKQSPPFARYALRRGRTGLCRYRNDRPGSGHGAHVEHRLGAHSQWHG